ncbi:apolipoprotein A-I [Sturnira hondurensis]|uniref:apolipoprotein A-I n=1 Tax=Sturnira hondurensis TaxID=192404 RepID=UPI001879405F|nr:apolipoprotein A-I [Sturnira hondurensis]
MKVVVLTLAVFFLTGSQAEHFWHQDDPQSQWDRVKDLATFYVDSVKDSGRDYVAQFEASALGKHLHKDRCCPAPTTGRLGHWACSSGGVLGACLPLSDYWGSIVSLATKLGDMVSPAAQGLWDNLKNTSRVLTQNLEDVNQVAKPHLEDLEKWQQDLELYYKKVVPVAKEFRDGTRRKLLELQTKLTKLSQDLRGKLEPFHDQLHQHFTTKLEELKESSACLSEFHNKANKQLQELHEKATPVLEDFQGALQHIWKPSRPASQQEKPTTQ